MHLFALALVTFLLLGCSRSETTGPTSDTLSGTIDVFSEPVFRVQVPNSVVSALAKHSTSQAARFVDESRNLNRLSQAFLKQPTQENQTRLQNQWQQTHLAFTRAQFGLIASEDSTRDARALQARIDTWPIQPGFIDHLPNYPFSGVVFDKTVDITIESLLVQHGFTDDEEVLLGLHSLEFLIYERDVADFQQSQNEWNDRRRELLKLVSAQLLADANLFNQWVTNFFVKDISNERILSLFLKDALAKTRLAATESNLFAAKETGHCLSTNRSLLVLAAEIESLDRFLVTDVPMGETLRRASPETFGNFTVTVDSILTTITEANDNEVARANLPLLLSALTHQMEFFSQAFEPINPG